MLIPIIKKRYKSLIIHLASKNHLLYRLFLNLYKPKEQALSGFLHRFSKSKQEFFVLQIGANDGITHDPIHKFIKRDGWNGILLEPQPYVFEKFTQRVYQKDDGIIVLNAAMGSQDGTAELFKISFSNDRWATGLARFDKNSLMKLIHSGKLDERIARNGITPPESKEDWISSENIDVVSFESLIKKFDISHVDLLMIDTEGFDAEIIKMLDFEKLLPQAIVFEDMHLQNEEYQSCVARLHANDFRTFRLGPNTICWQPELDKIVSWNNAINP